MGRIGTGLKVAGALAVLAPLKYGLYHRWKRRHEEKMRLKRGPIRFGSLSRDRQRQVLYYRRGQLQDYENTYRHGTKPRMKRYGS